jgi:hypothetical protein
MDGSDLYELQVAFVLTEAHDVPRVVQLPQPELVAKQVCPRNDSVVPHDRCVLWGPHSEDCSWPRSGTRSRPQFATSRVLRWANTRQGQSLLLPRFRVNGDAARALSAKLPALEAPI